MSNCRLEISNNFADVGNTYYSDYLAAAKKLGVINGIGNNKFNPDGNISRQDMFTMLYRLLKALDKMPTNSTGKSISDFSDPGSIASYVTEAIQTLVSDGVISGSNGMINLSENSSRAQMAQVIYNL